MRTGAYYVVEKQITRDEWRALPVEQSKRAAAQARVERLQKSHPSERYRVGERGGGCASQPGPEDLLSGRRST